MRWLNECTIIYSFVFTGKSLIKKEQIQHDDDTQIYIYKTLTDAAMMVRFFLSPQGFNFSDIYTCKTHYLEMKIILAHENLF